MKERGNRIRAGCPDVSEFLGFLRRGRKSEGAVLGLKFYEAWRGQRESPDLGGDF